MGAASEGLRLIRVEIRFTLQLLAKKYHLRSPLYRSLSVVFQSILQAMGEPKESGEQTSLTNEKSDLRNAVTKRASLLII